ncbi:MAG: cytochrome b/b6 domain-containing protein [Methyloligellaceae bacterium]
MTTTCEREAAIHPPIVRLTHWINAAAMLVLIASGWQIYTASPILPFVFPKAVTLGGWLGGALLWHFAAMWLLMANFLVLAIFGFASGRFRAKLWPISPKALTADLRAALSGRLGHADLAHYNSVQKLLYAGVLGAILLAILSGFAIWKPVQLQTLTSLMGGFQGARLVHFLAMAAITGFLVVHVVMALLVPRSLRAMVRGR